MVKNVPFLILGTFHLKDWVVKEMARESFPKIYAYFLDALYNDLGSCEYKRNRLLPI